MHVHVCRGQRILKYCTMLSVGGKCASGGGRTTSKGGARMHQQQVVSEADAGHTSEHDEVQLICPMFGNSRPDR